MYYASGGFLLLLICTCLSEAAELPSEIGKCSRTDPKLSQCLMEKVEKTLRVLKDGNKQLGVGPVEPFDIPSMEIGEGKGAVSVVQNYKNVLLHGLSETKLFTASFDFGEKNMLADTIIPNLRLEGDYKLNGKVLLLPIYGEGRCNVSLVNCNVTLNIMADEFQKGSKTHWKLKDFIIILTPERVIFKFDNLFNGDKRLSEEIHKVLNDNWFEIFKEIKFGYEKSIGLFLRNYADRIFSRVALDDMFLP